MDRGSKVLGIMPDSTFFEQVVDLNVGDVLIVYSDGVSEAMDEGGDFCGDDRSHLISAGIRRIGAGDRHTGSGVREDIHRSCQAQ